MQLIHNNQDKAIELLQRDVELLKDNPQLVAVALTGCEWLFGPVKEDLKELVAHGAKLTFIVGRRFKTSESPTIIELDTLPGVDVYQVDTDPPVDVRLIGDKHLYVAYHGINENKERDCWHSSLEGAPPKEIRAAKQYIARYESVMRPVSGES